MGRVPLTNARYLIDKRTGKEVLNSGTSRTRANISGIGGNNSCQQSVVKCFNCQGEGHMARQCPKPKRKRDATWFRDKVLLVEAQGSGKVLNEEELEFLADPGVAEGPVTQTVITYNATYQADDLDVYDFDCSDFSIAKAVLMANLSSYGLDVLLEVVQIVLWYLDSGCSKHMTRDLMHAIRALVRVVFGRGYSYFTISSLQLDLRAWKLE
ncbi:retrovirus-related pol polyprotein from transposon TNT 1-94 [Tanacetum coccineum]